MPGANHVFTVFSFIAFTSASVPLTWHLTEAWSTGACLFIFWSGLSSLVWFVNSIVWDGNVVNWTPAWCDVSTRITLAALVGIPASMLALQRRIFYMVRRSSSNVTTAQKRRAFAIDLLIGLGLPIFYMILSFIVQGHRFDILEYIGCYPAIVNTSLTYLLVTVPPLIIGIASLVFIVLNICYARFHRHSLDSWLECTPSRLLNSSSLYSRVVYLGLLAFVFSFTLSIRDLVTQIKTGSVPWPGWDAVHADFGRVDQIPYAGWAATGRFIGLGPGLKRWIAALCAFAAFLMLGTTFEAGERYKAFGRMVLRAVGGKSAAQRGEASGDIKSADVVKAYYTHEEIVLPIIKKHKEQFPPPSPTTSSPSLPSTPTISRTPSVKAPSTVTTLVSPPTPKVPEQRLTPYGSSYGTRAAIKPEDVGKPRTPPTPTSPGFGTGGSAGGDMLGVLLSSSYKNKGGERDAKKEKEKIRPKVMMTPF